MSSTRFEIRIALLGYVSVGKTTLLNAMLGDKFSEVSKKRTTAGINKFRLISSQANPDVLSSAHETLKQITEENKYLRGSNVIKECTFTIKLQNELVEMRPDTNLVIIDIPGVNEAGTSQMYLDFVENYWENLDCVIIVIDAEKGVNTVEQVDLLKFVKSNCSKHKEIPLVVVCNKVDEPDDIELMSLVDEARVEVARIFEVSDRKKSVDTMLEDECSTSKVGPAFVPMSAENAFLYRAASGLQCDEIGNIGSQYIDKIGREEIGKYRWKRQPQEMKHALVYEVVSDLNQYRERMEASNFDKFVEVLGNCVGGKKNQANILERQLTQKIEKLKPTEGFTDCLISIFETSEVLQKSTGYLKDKFWELYKKCVDVAFKAFSENPHDKILLQTSMKEIQRYETTLYAKLIYKDDCSSKAKKAEKSMIRSSMKSLIKRYCDIIVAKETNSTAPKLREDPWHFHENCALIKSMTGKHIFRYDNYWYAKSTGERRHGIKTVHPEIDQYPSHWEWDEVNELWKSKYTGKTIKSKRNPVINSQLLVGNFFSPQEWNAILSSVLLMKYSKYFCENFGREILALEWRQRMPLSFDFCTSCETANCGCTKDAMSPPLPGTESILNSIPSSPSNPEHWGHLIWLLCKFVKNSGAL